jgi:hypothetical protein
MADDDALTAGDCCHATAVSRHLSLREQCDVGVLRDGHEDLPGFLRLAAEARDQDAPCHIDDRTALHGMPGLLVLAPQCFRGS